MVRNRFASVLGALTLTVSMAALTAPSASASTATGVDAGGKVAFSGNAYGSQVKIAGKLANSGKTAYVVIGCTRKVPLTHRNSSVAVDIPGIGNVGAVENEALTRNNDGTLSAITRTHVADASLLPGLIEVGAIETQARASRASDGFHAETDFSIASLSVGGEEIDVTGEEQVIEIAGVGTLTLGKSKVVERKNSSFASITAVTLKLDDGTVVRIGHSEAGIDKAVNALFSGGAYGSTVKVADTLTSGRTAYQPIGCVGTKGKDRINEIASVNLGGLGTAQQVRSTVNAQQTPLPEAHAMNEIEDVNLAGGLLKLKGIVASVNVFEDENGDVTYNTNGTKLASIKVAGLNIPVPPPGGSVDLPGLGSLTFFQVNELAGGRGVEVIAVELMLEDDTKIVLGRAAATIKD